MPPIIQDKRQWLNDKIVENAPEPTRELQRCCFDIHTVVGGFNSGRTYTLRTDSHEKRDAWIDALRTAISDAREVDELLRYRTWPARVQRDLRAMYHTSTAQMLIALLIVTNFLINVVNFELLPEEGSQDDAIFNYLEYAFNALFLTELVFNLTAHWFFEFFGNGWNVFDLFVVIVSCAAMFVPHLPGVSLLRLIRVVRVLKLFKQMRSLRIILQSMVSAILPVANAFVVLLLFSSLYSVMAVMFFRLSVETDKQTHSHTRKKQISRHTHTQGRVLARSLPRCILQQA